MKRQALLITNPGEPGASNYCEGVNRDAESYRAFLKATFGGAWYGHEIEHLPRPSVAQLRLALQKLRAADYGLVIFSGHGEYEASKKATVLELRSGEEIDSAELRAGATRQTLILDCCRAIAPESRRIAVYAEALEKRAEDRTAECRRYYEERISDCASGLCILWGCSVGETAGDDKSRGGYYSLSLLDEAESWAKNNDVNVSESYSILSVVQAHDAATPRVRQLSGNRQNPTIDKPRSGPYFPFAVVA